MLISLYIACAVGNEGLCLSPGWLLNVYPVDAHCGPDFSVDTEPDDGFPSTLQPLF